jgi:hypothetical protein
VCLHLKGNEMDVEMGEAVEELLTHANAHKE